MSSDPLVKLENVSFAYDHARPVVDGLALTLASRQRIALTGHNGAGKTTLLHLIVGLLKPTSGVVSILGKTRTTESEFQEIRGPVGLVFQDPEDQLFCPSVREDIAFGPLNLGLSPQEAEERVREIVEMTGLEGFEDRVPFQLSKGEKRLVALAAVLAMHPKVLLLDEPAAGLDEETRKRLIRILKDHPAAMLIVSHDTELLDAVCTKRFALVNGRLEPVPSTFDETS